MKLTGTDARRSVRSILLLRFSSLGDLILLSSLIDQLRSTFPEAKITLAVREDLAPVYAGDPRLHRLLTVRRSEGLGGLWNLIRELRSHSWDLLYDAHGSLRSVLIRWFVPSRKKLVVNKRTWQRLLLIGLKWRLLEFRYFKDQLALPLTKWLGVPLSSLPTRICLSDAEQQQARQLSFFDGTTPVIGIVPSAQWPEKRWAPERFRELIRELRLKKFKVAVFGGPTDSFCETLLPLHDSGVQSFQGKLSLRACFAALARCRLVVANDTGLMHAAEAVGTDVVALLGPTGEEFGFVPYRADSRVVSLKMWCRPCSKNGQGWCIRGGRRPCLKEISTAEVLKTVDTYFQQQPQLRQGEYDNLVTLP